MEPHGTLPDMRTEIAERFRRYAALCEEFAESTSFPNIVTGYSLKPPDGKGTRGAEPDMAAITSSRASSGGLGGTGHFPTSVTPCEMGPF